MILPISTYGMPILRKVAKEIDKDYEGLQKFIDDLWETMYKSDGIGLAAPQVGRSIRIFVIDSAAVAEDEPDATVFKKEFINPKIVETNGDDWIFNEGCLSLPGIREDVKRPEKIRIQYYDRDFKFYDEEYDGVVARIIQHEYDHLQGVLFTDKVSPLRKRLLKGKLNAITKGKFTVNYKVKAMTHA